ncbi:MAG: hypothetical protein OES24_02990 [Acidimicrobiia bacterium]|nr:hypothetical protein [Acidimicrobiia bacterium]
MTVDPHVQDPGSAPITEVVVVRNGVEILRQPCESEQEAADIIAHWEEQPGVECAVVDLTTGREEGSADIDWTDPAIDYPAGRDDFGVEEA